MLRSSGMGERLQQNAKTLAVLTASEAWKKRIPAYRLKAMLAEAVLQGWNFALFSTEDCDMQSGRVRGDQWEAGAWAPTELSGLDVVVFQGGAPVLKRQKDVLEWVSSRFPLLRAKGPDKAQLPSCLEGSPVAGKIIPQAVLEPGNVEETLTAAMRRHGSIVVKLAASSSGRGVRFLIDEGQVWLLRDGRQSVAGTMEEIAALVARDVTGRAGYRSIVVQKFVRSQSHDGRALQFRVDVAKNPAGEWQVLRSFAHLAEIGEFASNIAFGGYLGSLERVVTQRRVRAPTDILDDAEQTALETARVLDRRADVSIFELGVDMLIDDDDRIWLLEANLQPETTSYEERRAEFTVGYAMAVATRAGQPVNPDIGDGAHV